MTTKLFCLDALTLCVIVLVACVAPAPAPTPAPTTTPTISPAAQEMIKTVRAFEDARKRGDTDALVALVVVAQKEEFRGRAELSAGKELWYDLSDCTASDDRVICKGIERSGALPCGVSELQIASAEYVFSDGKIERVTISQTPESYSMDADFIKVSVLKYTAEKHPELVGKFARLTREGGATVVAMRKEYCAQAVAQTTQFALQAPADAKVVKAFSKMDAACDGKTEWTVEATRDAWVDVGEGWFAKNGTIAQDNWKHISWAITLDGKEIKNLEKYFHGPKPLKLDCPGSPISAEMVGLEIYVPPLPVGDHQVTWKVAIESDLNDGYDDYKKGTVYEFTGTIRVKP